MFRSSSDNLSDCSEYSEYSEYSELSDHSDYSENMGCILSYKWICGFIGLYFSGGKGFLFGFLIGWLIDSMYRRPTISFTFRHGTADDFTGYQKQERTWQPYVDVTLQEAYRTLGLSETATDEEVRQAYRQMALRYHPDRVAAQGDAARQAAEKKFQEITEARDIIFRVRGL